MSVKYIDLDGGGGGCRFKMPDDAVVLEYHSRIDSWFKEYLQVHSLSVESVQTNVKLLGDAIIRIIKRKDYYEVFHNGVQLNEAKEAALLAYWIVKYRPFTVVPEFGDNVDSELWINEGFAAFIMLSAVINDGSGLSENYVRTLMYALHFWDLSKEAFMLISETIYEMIYTEK